MTDSSHISQHAFKFILLVIIFAVCWYLGRIFHVDVSYYQEILSKYPLVLSGLVFVVLYVATTTFVWFGPKDVLRISSAVLFGATVSTVFVWIGETANAAVMFHLSRVLGREYVQKKLGGQTAQLEKMKDDVSFLGVVAWRINPLVPFRLMDLGYGLTQIPFRKYLPGIIVVSFFRILWLQFILAGIGASLFDNFSAMLDYFLANPRIVFISAVYFFIVIIVTLAAVVARIIKRKK